jgi:hypothetical protein
VEQTAADLAFLDHVGLALAHADAVVDGDLQGHRLGDDLDGVLPADVDEAAPSMRVSSRPTVVSECSDHRGWSGSARTPSSPSTFSGASTTRSPTPSF